MLTDVLGTRSFQDLANFKTQNTLKVPAVVFENVGSGVLPNSGASYFLAERFKTEVVTPAGVGALVLLSQSWDCVPVNVTGKIENSNFGFSSSYGIDLTDNKNAFDIRFTKPTPFLGRPFSSGKKFAVVSYSVRATELTQTSISSKSSTSGNI